MPANPFTQEKNGYTITVWMISLELWAYIAEGNETLYRGTVEAENRIDAVTAASEKIRTWTAEEILEREG
jgi:hypothetical protein